MSSLSIFFLNIILINNVDSIFLVLCNSITSIYLFYLVYDVFKHYRKRIVLKITNFSSKKNYGAEICSICLETLNKGSISNTKCNHIFHTKCMNQYKATGISYTCPLCRERL